MIAYEKMHMDTHACHLAYLFEEWVVLRFALIASKILHPEIEHITEHVDGNSIFAHLLEHGYHFFLVQPVILNSQTA